MGSNQSRSSSSSNSTDQENERPRQLRDLPPPTSYTFKSAVEEGQREFLRHREELNSLQRLQESNSKMYKTAVDRLNTLQQKSDDHEERIRELEARAFQVRDYRDREEDIPNADEPQGAGRNRGRQEGRPKIRCRYCRKELAAGPYIRTHVTFHCPLAPLNLRGVRRGICPHCGRDLSVSTLKRHASGPCPDTRRNN